MESRGYYIQHRGIPSHDHHQHNQQQQHQQQHQHQHQGGGIHGSSSIPTSAFQMEPSLSPSPSPPAAGQAFHGGGGTSGEVGKKKRGRPRKYAPDGSVALALSPSSGGQPETSLTSSSGKKRGRPPGTGRKQHLASLGKWVLGSAGIGFTPHVIMISVGEDIATKIMSFSQQGPRAVCILSANGALSSVTLRQPATSGGTVTYEGHFEILSLTGSYLVTDDGGSRSRSGGLSISLSSPDGRVIGGGVGGLLIAASSVQVVVGSFVYGGSKTKDKTQAGSDQDQENSTLVTDKQNMLSATLMPCQNQNPTPPVVSGWHHGPRQMEMRNAHIDIDLTRG